MIKFPKRLEKGSTVGVICPCSAITAEQEKKCREVLEKMGFRVKMADNLTADYAGYMAGTGKIRAQWINRMFADPEVDAVFCARGGDGCGRVVEYLDLDLIKANPKIFVGYSDVTTFHLLFNQVCSMGTFHGPMVSSNMIDAFDEESEAAFWDALTCSGDYVYKNPIGFPVKVLREGRARGVVTGGNLALLSASMGTPYEVDTRGKIFFIEEINETGNRLERMVYQLKNAGKFRDSAGILLGQFTDCDNKPMPEYDAICCFRDALEDYDGPVLYNLQTGHGEKHITIPLGAECNMDTKNRRILFHMERESTDKKECIGK
ncbi:MAG: LD-carboxypeptidase [Lachnospiraceae bacterium]|nr:LD-carboxypeptidase [Lachnospiraceae bacterium]